MTTSADSKAPAIWGFGREGRAAFAFFAKTRPDLKVAVLNDTPLPPDVAAELRGVEVLTGPEAAAALAAGRFDFVVKSPGIPLNRPEIAAAKANGARFTSATNLWFEQKGATPVIAVTGTKGKSTTSTLVFHLLRDAGLDVGLFGNVGVAPLGQPAPRDYAVVELSSYQTADLEHAPDIVVFTNLSPEHMTWHGSVARYYEDKLRVASLSPRAVVICNGGDIRLREQFHDRPNVVWYNGDSGFRVRDGALWRDGARVDTSLFPLKGSHNLENLAAALTLLDHIGARPPASGLPLEGFHQLPHRLSEFFVEPDVLCVDDSISTTPVATIAALETFAERPAVLLLGGTERGQDYADLYKLLAAAKRIKAVIALPPNGARIFSEMSGLAMPFPMLKAANLREAVDAAFTWLEAGDMLLLSPAAPSFGEFANFEERGEAFVALCRKREAERGGAPFG